LTAAGDIFLVPFPRASGLRPRLRPVAVLARLPGPFQTWLLAGISTQLAGLVPGWDEVLAPGDPWFAATGLERRSALRLSYLASIEGTELRTHVGVLPPGLVERLQRRLGAWIVTSEASEPD
jgi:hypothetical protein